MHIFLFVLLIALSVLLILAVVAWYYATTSPTYYGSSWMGQMWGSHIGGDQSNWGMGGMMGGDGTGTITPSYLWLIPMVLIGAVSLAIIGIGFYLIYPELKYIRGKPCGPENKPNASQGPSSAKAEPPLTLHSSQAPNSCSVLLKAMTPEEQRVLNVLLNHNGKYLQKYVSKEAELSRLKTHRILARFVERGIVTVKEFGNTNEVFVADWVTAK